MATEAQLNDALSRGLLALAAYQETAGNFESLGDFGVWPTAQAILGLAFLGELSEDEATAAGDELIAIQLPDGSFERWPGAGIGDVSATVIGIAALHCTCHREAEARARAWADAHGGTDAVPTNFLIDPMMTRLFAAVAGIAPASYIPSIPMIQELIPGLQRLVESKINAYVFVATVQVAALRHFLAGDWGPEGSGRGWLATRECKNALETTISLQDADGGWDGDLFQTILATMALYALGLPKASPEIQLALGYIRGMRRSGRAGRRYAVFSTSVWTTGLAIRALVAADVPVTDARIARATHWVCRQNRGTRTTDIDDREANAVRDGGWSFQAGNTWCPDTDDTGVVLSGIGALLCLPPDARPEQDSLTVIRNAIDAATAWLISMQNADGGWAAFVHGMPTKPRGPMYLNPPDLTHASPLEMLRIFRDPPAELGSPATEDVTGRVLLGLAVCGWDLNAPPIRAAVQFLRQMQEDDGSWWGAWMVNYVQATSTIIWALGRLGMSREEPILARALAWLRSRQNDDGGWGESPASYEDPKVSGRGPSMPALTGWACCALMAAGLADDIAVARGIDWLLQRQDDDGYWPIDGWRNVFQPPSLFYVLPAQTQVHAVEALGMYRRHLRGLRVQIRSDESPWSIRVADGLGTRRAPEGSGLVGGDWSDDFLDGMADVGDPEVDTLIAELFAQAPTRDASIARADSLIALLFRNDDPVPPGLPSRLTAWFEDTARLPADTDFARIRRGEALFTRVGWALTSGLFCSSLPQSYASAVGARVLVATRGLTTHTQARILETAQFIFDITQVGGLQDRGRGIRSAQKVRLLHGAIRRFLTMKAGWHEHKITLPIHQEELAGTILSFSLLAADGACRLGADIGDAEVEDWLYLWTRVGIVLGVDPRLLPATADEGRRLATAIRRRRWRGSPGGRLLAKDLVDCMARWLPLDIARDMPIAMIRRASGDTCGDVLGLPRVPTTAAVLEAAVGFSDRHPRRVDFGRHLSHALLVGLVDEQRGRKHASFRIPDGLLDQWG